MQDPLKTPVTPALAIERSTVNEMLPAHDFKTRFKQNLREYARGTAGGLLFGTPLIYTMEMWSLGYIMSPAKLIIFVVGNFFVLLILEKYSGFRQGTKLPEEIQDAVVAQGLGMGISVAMLWLLNIINLSMNYHEILGKIIVETVGVSIGVSVAMAQLGELRQKGHDKETVRKKAGFWGAASISLAGSVFFGLNVAPTDEPFIVALQMTDIQILLLALLGLILVFCITYAFNFKGGHKRPEEVSWIRVLFKDTVNCYVIAILVAAVLLILFCRIDGDTGFHAAIKMIVVLGFVNSLGASAAKLIL